MKSMGMIRRVDELGRIVLPVEIRRNLNIEERDELEIYVEADRIVIQKFEPLCIFCASSNDLVTYSGKNVCQSCIKKMSRFLKQPGQLSGLLLFIRYFPKRHRRLHS